MISLMQSRVKKLQALVLPAGSLRSRFMTGMFWALAGTLISQSLQLAAMIFVARWLGKHEYGELGIVKSTVGMFGVFVGLGLGLTATKYISEVRPENPKRAGRIAALTLAVSLVSGLAVTAGLILVSSWLASHTLASPGLSTPLAIGAGLLFFGEVKGVQNGILAGIEAFAAIARINLVAGLCSFPVILAFAWLWGLNGAICGLVASLALNCLLNGVILYREAARASIPISFSDSWKERSVLWQFSAPAFLSQAVVTPTAWICSVMLVNRPGGYDEMGLFSAADQWRNIVLFLPGIISRVLLPILSSHSKESAREDKPFSRALELGFSTTVMVAFLLVALLSSASALITQAYGKEFASMAAPLAAMLYAGGVSVLGTTGGLAIQAKGAMWLGFAINLLWAVLMLISFKFFLLSRGAWGLSIAYAFSAFCLACLVLWYVCERGYYPWWLGIRTFLACMALLVFAFGPLYLPATVRLESCPATLALAAFTAWLLLPERVAAIAGRGASGLLRRASLRSPSP